MADNRYGRDNDWRGANDRDKGPGSGSGRDHDRSDDYRGYGQAPGLGRGHDDADPNRDRGFGAYSQGGRPPGSRDDADPNRDRGFGAYSQGGRPPGGHDDADPNRDRGFGAYSQGGGRPPGGHGIGGHIDHDRQSGYDDDRHLDPAGYARGNGLGRTEPRHGVAEPDGRRGRDLTQAPPPAAAYRTEARDNERFDNRDENRRVAIDETDEVIASNKVEGTRVYNRRGERLGTIENFMVGKRSGRVEYVVMSFGGFLGLGERHYPLPWSVLKYDAQLGGYKIDVDSDERALRHAPSYRPSEEPRWDRAFRQHVYGFYGLT